MNSSRGRLRWRPVHYDSTALGLSTLACLVGLPHRRVHGSSRNHDGPGAARSNGEDTMMSSKAHLKCFFSERVAQWAACYSEPEPASLSARNLISRQRIALEMVEGSVPRASRVLDAGCGPGEMAAGLMRHGYEVWGLDIAEAMVRHARERCRSDRFRVGDIEHLPFRDNTFDAVVCLGVIEYLDMDELALREMWRVLKPGGSAVVSSPNAVCPFYTVARLFVGLTDAARPLYHFVKYRLRGRRTPGGQAPYEVRHRRYYRGNWQRLLRSVGLEPDAWVCHSWGWHSSAYRLPLARQLSRQPGRFRHILVRLFGPARVDRAVAGLARNRALNWLLAEHVVRVRAVK